MAATVAKRSGGRVALRQAEVRRRILAVAERLMEQHGIERVTLDEITDGAGIARRSFYHHFASKHDVLVPIARARTMALTRRIDRLVMRLGDPAEVIAAALRHVLRGIVQDPLCIWFMLRSGLPYDRLQEGMGASYVRDLLRGIDAGRFHIPNPEVVHTVMAGAVIALIGARVGTTLDDADIDDAVEHLLRLLGVPRTEAHSIAHRRLRPLPADPGAPS
jgi:AcrR family transcriptional regulator